MLDAAESVVQLGISEDEVREAVNAGREPEGYLAIAPGGLPEGLTGLAEGMVSFGTPSVWPSVTWWYRGSGGNIRVAVTEGGRALDLLAGATVRGNQRPVRGVVGTVGTPRTLPPDASYLPVRYVWAEDGLVVVVDAQGVAEDVVEAFVESLTRVTTVEGLARLQASSADVTPEQLVGEGETFAVGGRWDGGVWAVGVAGSGPNMSGWLHGVVYGGAPFSMSAGGPPGIYVPDPAHRLVTGSIPGEVVRVDIQFPDGSLVPAEIGGVAGIPETFYGQWLTVTEDIATYVVLGYDAAGTVVARFEFAT